MIRRPRQSPPGQVISPLAQNLVVAAASAVLTALIGALLLFFAEVPIKIQANQDGRESNTWQIQKILLDLDKIKENLKNHRHNQPQ